MDGVANGWDDGDLPPWAFVKALGLGFAEIPTAVGENYTFQEFIQERADPNSFWYKNANTIGLGMSIFFDPTMYLTFGATGASKVAARGILAQGWKQSSDEAVQYMANGMRHPVTGKTYSVKDDIDEVMAEIHLAHNMIEPGARPFTLGDALQRVRDVDRSGASGAYRKIFARGGRGTRFAGLEIPGTRAAGNVMADAFRKRTSEVLSMKGTPTFLARAFVPDAKLKVIAQDARRAVALAEFRAIESEATALGEKLVRQAADIAKIDNPVARGVATMFGKPIDYIPQAERRGILRSGTPTDAKLKRMVDIANLRKADIIKQARAAGLDNKRVEEIKDLWEQLVKRYDDPVEVVSHFLLKTATRLMAYKHIDRVLENPLLARRIGDDLAMSKEGLAVRSVEDFEQIIKQKARPFKHGKKTYAVSDAVYEALDQIKNPAFLDHEMNRMFQMMNGVQNLWKIPATVMNPAFHAMNLVGGAWNNMLAGPYGPIDYIESWAKVLQRRAAAGEGGVAGRGLLTATKPILRRRDMDPEATEKLFQAFEAGGGGGRSGFISAEVSTGLARQAARQTGDRPWLPRFRGGLETGRAFTAARRTFAGLGAAEIGTNVAESQDWIDDFDIPLGNEFAALALGAPEIARTGRFVASFVEEVLRLTPFNETWKDKSLRQAMEAIGPITPPQFAKMGPKGLTKRQEKAMFDLGTEMAVHFQFDYTKLTPIERMFAKTVFPFWTFYKNNFLLQTREIVNRPRFVQGFYHMADYIEEEWGEDLSPEMEKMLPEYFNNLGAFQIPVPPFAREAMGLPQDTPLFLNPKLPFVSLNLFPPLWELFNDRSQTPFYQRALQVISPITGSVGPFAGPVPGAKLAFEAITGTNLGLARPIDYQRAASNDWRQSFTPAPGYFKYLPDALTRYLSVIRDPVTGEQIMPATMKYIADAMSTPFITNYGKVVPTGYEGAKRDKAKADLISWMTGLRLMPVDTLKISRSWAYRMENSLESHRAELREQGLELEPEDDELLRRTRALIREVEAQWDIREQEIFG
jgi:hypothetical protein